MNKNTIWIIAGVIAVLVICCVGTTAAYFIYSRGGFTTPSPTPFLFPTPNLTLTALYRPPTLSLPTVTQQYVYPTTGVAPATTSTGSVPTLSYTTPNPTNTATITTMPNNRPSAVIDAPYLATAPVIDGTWEEWTTPEYPIDAVVYGKANWEGNNDLLGSYRIGWDNTYIYLAVKVHDDRYVQVSTGEYIYLGDSLEVLLDTNLTGDFFVKSLSGDDYQLGISPGKPTPGANMEAFLWFPVSLTGARNSVRIGAIGGDGLYRVEVAIPWSIVNVAPYKNLQMGFAVSIMDDDLTGTAKEQTMLSSSPYRILADPTTWGTIILK